MLIVFRWLRGGVTICGPKERRDVHTQFQGYFKGLYNINLRKIVLNSFIINTLHVGIYIYTIELFSKAAITSIHVILLHILAVLGRPLGTLFTDGHHLNIAYHQYSKQILLWCPSYKFLPLAGTCLCPLCHCGQVVSRAGLV